MGFWETVAAVALGSLAWSAVKLFWDVGKGPRAVDDPDDYLD